MYSIRRKNKKKYPIIGKIPEAALLCHISISIKGVLFEGTLFERANLPCVPLVVTCIIDGDRFFSLAFFTFLCSSYDSLRKAPTS